MRLFKCSKKVSIYFFYLLVVRYCGTSLTAEENEIAVSLIKHLRISSGILVSNSVNELQNLKALKILLRQIVFTMTYDWNDLRKLDQTQKIMTIMKIKNAAELHDFMLMYPSVSSNSILWTVFIPENYTYILKNTLHIPYDNEFFAIYPKDPKNYEIAELYRIKGDTTMLKKSYGLWSEELGLSANSQSFELRRKNFENVSLLLRTENELPCSHRMECFQRQVWDDLSKILNFTTLSISKTKLAKDHPDLTPDADIQIKTLNLVRYRKSLVAPIMIAEISFYIKHETNSLEGWSSLFKPFNKELWTVLFVWLIITTLVVVAIGYFQKLTSARFKLTEYLFISLDTITSQEGSETTNKISHRIATLALRITSTVILPAYSAAVISFLTIQTPKVPFKDLYGFAQDGTYIIGSINNSYPINLLLETNDPNLSIIREKYMVPLRDMPTSHVGAYRRLCTENLAFLGYNDAFEELQHQFHNGCKLLKIRPPLFYMPSGIMLAADSPFKTVLYNQLVLFRETGILKILNKKLQRKDFQMKKEKKNAFRPINMNAVKTIMVIGITGIIISIFILTFEILWFHWYRIGGSDITYKFNKT